MRVQQLYNLQAVNGALLPAADISAGVFLFLRNGTWMSSATYADPQPLPDVGTYDIDDDTGALTMYQGSATWATGVLNEHVVIVSAGTYTFVATRDVGTLSSRFDSWPP